ncbi:MAG TPA: winged helix-turn-helix domain-containing protein [Glaciihabitans sp.]|nr:winged helix-turn-helix domain-containing protein [Glaciihabitans sp.]
MTVPAASPAVVTYQDVDPLLLNPTRLLVLSLLDIQTWCEVAFLRATVGLSVSGLARHLAILREAGYIAVSPGMHDTTWVELTRHGQHQGLDQAYHPMPGEGGVAGLGGDDVQDGMGSGRLAGGENLVVGQHKHKTGRLRIDAVADHIAQAVVEGVKIVAEVVREVQSLGNIAVHIVRVCPGMGVDGHELIAMFGEPICGPSQN